MSHKLLFGFVFVAAATIGYSYVLHKDKVQAGRVRICSKHLISESQLLRSPRFLECDFGVPTCNEHRSMAVIESGSINSRVVTDEARTQQIKTFAKVPPRVFVVRTLPA
jgi:hypothetical protein